MMWPMATDFASAGRYWPIWVAVIPVALWALVRAFGLESGGMVATAMFFTPYAAVGAVLATASSAAAVLPRAIGNEITSAAERDTLTVLSANVYLGKADPDALIEMVDRLDPDILSVQELTPSFAEKLRQAGIERRLPHSVLMAQPKGRGGGLYARFP